MQLKGNNGTYYNVFKTFCKVHFVWRNHKQVTHRSGTILWPPVEYCVHPPSVAATSWPFWDMSSSRLLKVCVSIWHQDVINRFARLHLEPSTNQFLVFSAQMLDWIQVVVLFNHSWTISALWQGTYIFLEEPACSPPIVQPMRLLLPCALLFHVHYQHDITALAPGPVPILAYPLLALLLVSMVDPERTGVMQNRLQQIAMRSISFTHNQH